MFLRARFAPCKQGFHTVTVCQASYSKPIILSHVSFNSIMPHFCHVEIFFKHCHHKCCKKKKSQIKVGVLHQVF